MRIIRYLLAFIPTKLPVSRSELAKFTSDILELGNWEFSDSTRLAIARAILHLDISKSYVTKRSFYLAMRRSITNEIAFSVLEEQRQQAQQNAKGADGDLKTSGEVEQKIS